MRALAILIATIVAAVAGYQLVEATRTGLTSPLLGLGAVVVLALVVFAGAAGLWRGAHWGAILVVIAALIGVFVIHQQYIFLAFGGPIAPEIALKMPYFALGGFAAVLVLVVLSWRGLGQR